ncbi:RNA polymerase sigma factor [Nocardia sp. NPDC127526]|uniref:RNA polymerase sigma factor n=1 Tax=Nocardia sp. NPDC127526 TaxID=3345393 RepID=UPI00362C66DA
MTSDGAALRDAAFEALLGEVLRECAQEPLLLVAATESDNALLRIARAPEPAAPVPAKRRWLRPGPRQPSCPPVESYPPQQPYLPPPQPGRGWQPSPPPSQQPRWPVPAPERPTPRRAPAQTTFDEILVIAYESISEILVGWAAKQVGDRGDAEDIVQTALMRVYARQPDITRVDEMCSYLWATVKNLVRDSWRRAAAERERLDPDGEERIAALAERAELPFDDLITLRHLLIAALDQLPRREREAVVLRTYEGNTYAETAAIMGLSSGTVKAYVHSALAKVRAGLHEVA